MLKESMETKTDNQEYTNLRTFLLVRTDRIGDVMLSTPVAASIKSVIPEARVSLLCSRVTAVIGERNPDIDTIINYDSDSGVVRPFLELHKELRSKSFDCAVVIHPTFRLALLMWSAGIPVRIGTGFRFYSWLFNRKHYEHRKVSEKHESQYNINLLNAVGLPVSTPQFKFSVTKEDDKIAQQIFENLGLSTNEPCIVVHPGSRGSGMDWPLENFAEACRLMSKEIKMPIVVTWGHGEEHLAEFVYQHAGSGVSILPQVYPLSVLAAFLRSAALLLVPSTGVLHIANTICTPVLGLYPPVRHESPQRWGAYGREKDMLVPDMEACSECNGGPCKKKQCMELITPDMVCKAAKELIHENSDKKKHSHV